MWARTVKSPNPAFAGIHVPLASTFMLSTKAGKEAYVAPVIESGSYHFTVKVGKPKDAEAAKNGTGAGKRSAFRCLMSGAPVTYDYIRSEGKAGRMGARLMAIVAEGARGRVYLSPTPEHETLALSAAPDWKPEMALPANTRDFKTPIYGLTTYGDLFTDRQLVTLTTFSDLVREARERVRADALIAGLPDDGKSLRDGGTGAVAYAEAVGVYLGEVASKITAYHCSVGVWRANMDKSGRAFGRQAIPMVWDYPECNPFAGAGGDWEGAINDAAKVIAGLGGMLDGHALQAAAQIGQGFEKLHPVVSTDPPYYDNVGYADLSDYFYVWLRKALRDTFSRPFCYARRAKSRGTSRNAVSPRWKGKG